MVIEEGHDWRQFEGVSVVKERMIEENWIFLIAASNHKKKKNSVNFAFSWILKLNIRKPVLSICYKTFICFFFSLWQVYL